MKNDVLLPHGVRNYLEKHKLDDAISTALEGVLRNQPEDPLGYIAEEMSHRSFASPGFSRIEFNGTSPDVNDLIFDIYMSVRGVPARMNSMNLGPCLLKVAVPSSGSEDGEGGAAAAEEAARLKQAKDAAAGDLAAQARRQRARERLIRFVEKNFNEGFAESSVDDFLYFQDRCASLIKGVPLPEGMAPVSPMELSSVLLEALLVSCCRALDTTVLDFLRRVFVHAQLPNLLAPPLRSVADLPLWRERWPKLALPALTAAQCLAPAAAKGAAPTELFRPASLCFALAIGPFAQALGAEPTAAGQPPKGWVASSSGALEPISAEAVKLAQAEKAPSLAVMVKHVRKAAETVIGADGVAQETNGVLIAAASEAWVVDEETGEGAYEIELGKKLSLEQLVDLYEEAAEDGWLRMILDPFRHEDASVGCELLKARKPELRLVQDFGQGGPPGVKGEMYSCPLKLEGSMPATIRSYVDAAPIWHEADGCARCLLLCRGAESALPTALDVACTIAEVEVLLVDGELSEATVVAASARADEVLRTLAPTPPPGEEGDSAVAAGAAAAA